MELDFLRGGPVEHALLGEQDSLGTDLNVRQTSLGLPDIDSHVRTAKEPHEVLVGVVLLQGVGVCG